VGSACFRYLDDVEHDLDAIGFGHRVDWHDTVKCGDQVDYDDTLGFGDRAGWHDAVRLGSGVVIGASTAWPGHRGCR
jgi:hypothetical protein